MSSQGVLVAVSHTPQPPVKTTVSPITTESAAQGTWSVRSAASIRSCSHCHSAGGRDGVAVGRDRGELVGTRRVFDERLTVFLLSARNHHHVPLRHASQDARREWSGYFADLLVRVRSEILDYDRNASWVRELGRAQEAGR